MVALNSTPEPGEAPCTISISRPSTGGGAATYTVRSLEADLVDVLTRIQRAHQDGDHVCISLREGEGKLVCYLCTREREYGEPAPEFPGCLPV